ncbi:acetyl-CoA hydrolase/transferase C-terminal domain-containing protein [Natrialbaceae archaeon A-chndr2]
MVGTVTNRIEESLPKITAEKAASTISTDATVLVSGFGSVGYPKSVPLALVEDDREFSLTVISGGSTGAEIDTELVNAGAITRRFPYQSRAESRAAINSGDIHFHDRNISSVSDEVQYGRLADPDIAIIEAVAVGEDWLIPSTSIGHTPAFVESADRLIVEINHAQPLELQLIHDVYRLEPPNERSPIPLTEPDGRIGSPRVTFNPDKLEAVVETERRDVPYSFRDPTDVDKAICANFAPFLIEELNRSSVYEDSVRLQFGVGSLGNALMNAFGDIDFDDRNLIYYGEVIQDGLLDLIDSGKLASASATSLALSEEGQDRLFSDIDRYAEDIVLRPADISNNPTTIDRFGIIGVNSALEVDLYGHVNSTHINGSRLMNGVGGSGDFNRNSLVSVTALPSITSNGDLSRIVPMVSHVDHTEHDIDIIVTEQGVADLRGLSPSERAQEIIGQCAHPTFRSQLQEYVTQAESGHISHDLENVFSWPPI